MRAEPARESPERRIAPLVAAQSGLVSRRQLRAAGVSDGQIGRRVADGRLNRLHRGVYAVGHPVLGVWARRLAATLACGEEAVLSHRTAADVSGIRPSSTALCEVTVPTVAGRTVREGIRIHRVPTLPAEDVTRCEGLPITTLGRTLVDLAAVLPSREVSRAIERAEGLRLFDLGEVQAALARNRPRPGTGALAAVLARYAEPPLTREELERRFFELCSSAALPRPRANAPIGPYEVDFLWEEQRLVVETDGWATHGTRAAFERDRARDAFLATLGYRVVRFTWRQVVQEPETVVRTLRRLLASTS